MGLLRDCYGIATGLLWDCYGIAMGQHLGVRPQGLAVTRSEGEVRKYAQRLLPHALHTARRADAGSAVVARRRALYEDTAQEGAHLA